MDNTPIKNNLKNTPCNWWLRSAYSYNSNIVGSVDYYGYVDCFSYVDYSSVNDYIGILPACLII